MRTTARCRRSVYSHSGHGLLSNCAVNSVMALGARIKCSAYYDDRILRAAPKLWFCTNREHFYSAHYIPTVCNKRTRVFLFYIYLPSLIHFHHYYNYYCSGLIVWKLYANVAESINDSAAQSQC